MKPAGRIVPHSTVQHTNNPIDASRMIEPRGCVDRELGCQRVRSSSTRLPTTAVQLSLPPVSSEQTRTSSSLHFRQSLPAQLSSGNVRTWPFAVDKHGRPAHSYSQRQLRSIGCTQSEELCSTPCRQQLSCSGAVGTRGVFQVSGPASAQARACIATTHAYSRQRCGANWSKAGSLPGSREPPPTHPPCNWPREPNFPLLTSRPAPLTHCSRCLARRSTCRSCRAPAAHWWACRRAARCTPQLARPQSRGHSPAPAPRDTTTAAQT